MTDLLLIYPYFNDDNSIFKFPPLGLGYMASCVRGRGFSVQLIDCTFQKEEEVLKKARKAKARFIGISCMSSMKDAALGMAQKLRGECEFLLTGGPLPTVDPREFLEHFDLVVVGEGEETMLEILQSRDAEGWRKVKGVAFKESGRVVSTPPREFVKDLDSLPFPSRDLFDNESYKRYFRRRHGYTITSMMASRGCPFNCEFCSRPVFGRSYRGRQAASIVDEMEEILSHGYDRVWIADDIFPLTKEAGMEVCREIIVRGLDVQWECLCRVDVLDRELASRMVEAGCHRVFFGMESGNDAVLKLMNKQTSVEQGLRAVQLARSAGIKTGGFFILGYPGETNETMLDTMRVASSMPLDYLSLTVPYPIPGTELYRRIGDRMVLRDMARERHGLVKHVLTYDSEFSSSKLKFGITKTMVQHHARRLLGPCYGVARPFELVTDRIFRRLP